MVQMAQQDIDDAAAAQAIEDAAIEAMNLSDAKTAAMTGCHGRSDGGWRRPEGGGHGR